MSTMAACWAEGVPADSLTKIYTIIKMTDDSDTTAGEEERGGPIESDGELDDESPPAEPTPAEPAPPAEPNPPPPPKPKKGRPSVPDSAPRKRRTQDEMLQDKMAVQQAKLDALRLQAELKDAQKRAKGKGKAKAKVRIMPPPPRRKTPSPASSLSSSSIEVDHRRHTYSRPPSPDTPLPLPRSRKQSLYDSWFPMR